MKTASSLRRRLALWICPELCPQPQPVDQQVASQIFRGNKVPTWWWNTGVRDFLTGAHRRMRIEDARAEAVRRFGAAAPSKSSIQRYWARLDLRIANAGEGAIPSQPASKEG
jgi:hypothetical protein